MNEDENKVDEAITPSSDDNTTTNTDSNLVAELEKERKARQELTARAKRAEQELKRIKSSITSDEPNEPEDEVKPSENRNASDNTNLFDERILISQGMKTDLLKDLKTIAQLRGVSLLEAQNDSTFKRIKEDFEREEKVKDASMGASKGSQQAKPKVTASTPGLSKEEHKKIAMEKMGM